jgi:hypothetical protein
MNTYQLCLLLIERDRTDGLQIKLDLLYALDRITEAQYTELTNMLNGQ